MRALWYWPFVRPEELGLAEAFAERGHALTVQAVAGRIATDHVGAAHIRSDVPALASRTEGTLQWLTSRATAYPRRARARAHAVASEHPDVVHVVYLNYFTDWYALARLARTTKLVATVHDVVPHQRRVPAPVERALLARTYAACPTIVVHHPSVAARLCSEFPVDPARVHHVPWAVPPVAAHGPRPDDGTLRLLMFGTLRRNKGVDVLLDAFRRIDDPDLRLVVAGRGFADVEALVREAAAADSRIHAEIGYVDEARKDALYAESDVVVLPYTTFSSQSAVLHDAYAHGRPVVVSEVGALGAAVREDGSGWVVPPSDPDALAEALCGLRGHEARRARHALAAKATADARGPAQVAALLEALYLGL